MRKFLPGLVVGVIFGAGLALSDMINPARVLAFLQASERAVAEMGTDGRVVLVGEAVLAGDAPDATDELRVRIARQLGQGGGQ